MRGSGSDHGSPKREPARQRDVAENGEALRAENLRLRERIRELESMQRDLGRQQKLEQIVLHTLVETCPFRIYAKDLSSRFIFGNSELAKAVGAAPDQVVGKNDYDFFPAELALRYHADEQRMYETGEAILAKEEPTTDPETGEPWWLLTSKVPLRDPDGKVFGLVGIGFNITARKRLEQDLVERNQALQEANAELVKTREELVQSSKLAALGALVAGIAHELNTPIGNSVLVATTLQESVRDLEASLARGITRSELRLFMDKAHEGTEILLASLSRAADLVASFKQVAVDRTTAARRVFNLKETVGEILLTLSPTLRKTSHRVKTDIPADLMLDSYPGPFGQIVTTLVNNALVHAFDGINKGTIRIEAVAEGDQKVRIVISDNGRGIADAHLTRVFDPFFTTKLGQGGSGLGLSVAYNLTTGILGGSLEVTSRAGEGARFELRLPLVAPQASDVAAPPA